MSKGDQLRLGYRADFPDAGEIAIDLNLEAETAVGISIDEDPAQSVASVQIRNNAQTSVFDVHATGATSDMIDITSVVTTASVLDINVDTLTTGQGISLQSVGESQTSGILLDVGVTASGSLAAMTGNVAKFASSLTSTDTGGTDTENFDTVLISRTSIMNGAAGALDADGAALKIETTATQTAGTLTEDSFAVEITHNVYSSSKVAAIKVTSDNGSSGGALGIDLSAFAAGEGVLKVPAGTAAITNTDVANADGFFNVDVGGTMMSVPYYIMT